ncbi:Nickel transport complex protein, NikM subunit [Desulfosarcina variabilis str. Montpellier]|uniref:DUF4198 domain-containing protein n=1 Tax=Desulfosarcina variabilis TaxID=2300 RepID=UPI003AFAEA93
MKNKEMSKAVILIIVSCLCLILAPSAFAHKLWINTTDYYPELFSHPKYAPVPQAKIMVYFGWGHKLPVSDAFSADYFNGLNMIEPDGKKKELKPGTGAFMATEVIMKDEGARIFAASVKPGFYGDVKGKKNFYKMRYEMYAKTLVAVGNASSDAFSKPVGQRFEIVPLQNPHDLKAGDWIAFKVLLDGKPAKGAEISASPYAKPEVTVVDNLSNKKEAKIRVVDYTGPWIVTAKLELPASEEFKEKCEKLHFVSTLTFSVP